jgi:hypothetical protein
MVAAALESGGIAVLLAAACLLFATRSVRMSAIALAAIVTTLVFVVGWLVFLGWRLGVLDREKEIGVQGAHLNLLCLFLRTSIPSILDACLPA